MSRCIPVDRLFEHALASGALFFFPSDTVSLECGGIPFQLQMAPALADKPMSSAPKTADPFANIDPRLLIAELDAHYRLLFNKFCVVRNHILIVTRAFERQDAHMCARDFEAVGRTRDLLPDAGEMLYFYNCGKESGASQPHRHFQAVPFPRTRILDLVSAGARDPTGICTVECYSSFVHGVVYLDGSVSWPEALLHAYTRLSSVLGVLASSFNLLFGKEWMLMVPRRSETADGLSFNSLVFTGCLLTRNVEERERVRQLGPLQVLRLITLGADG